MASRDQDIKARLLATFRVEAEEHVQAITANLLALEHGVPQEQGHELLEATFREVHTLKGAARSVSLRDVEALCQALESVLSRITRGRLPLTPPIHMRLQAGVDSLTQLLSAGEVRMPVREVIGRLEESMKEMGAGTQGLGIGGQPAAREASPPTPPPPIQTADTIRLAASRLDALLLQAEELLTQKLAAGERVREARALVEALEAEGRGWGSGVRDQGLGGGDREAMRMGKTPAPNPHPPPLAVLAQARGLLGQLTKDQRAIAGVVDAVLGEMRRLRMMPASTVLDLFPRMVRDLARGHGKEVEWEAEGADLDVDRKVLETIKDPLIHLVRNAIDHGIEPQAVRVQSGKPPQGRVTVRVASLEGNRLEIHVEDDGKGIDLAQVKAAAVRARLLPAAEAETIPDAEVLDLIFRSGFSTSPIITDVSGHGLGLAIVKEQVDRLGGLIRVESRVGAGTSVRMTLPASIATFRGLLVQAGGQPFLLPTDTVERTTRVAPAQLESVKGRQAIRWRGAPLSVARLSDLLGLSEGQGAGDRGQTSEAGLGPPPPMLPCVIVRAGGDRAGFLVEEILGEREVLVKELRPPLIRVRNVTGGGLLGTGQLVLTLRSRDLLKSIQETPRPTPLAAREAIPHQPALLVVDDSITTRVMEKNLLEAAGYEVRVAADGIEAWTLLKSEAFDLMLSDIDMPRLNGFDLTARIRADQTLADLPVVLVTALESREDKERGIEVGANAYIVKSSFDQSNLLEIIRRLI